MPDICAGEMRSILCYAACWIHELAAVQLGQPPHCWPCSISLRTCTGVGRASSPRRPEKCFTQYLPNWGKLVLLKPAMRGSRREVSCSLLSSDSRVFSLRARRKDPVSGVFDDRPANLRSDRNPRRPRRLGFHTSSSAGGTPERGQYFWHGYRSPCCID